MRIAILRYNTPVRGQLRDIPVSDLRWLHGAAAGEQIVADLREDDHLIFYPLRRTILGSFAGLRCRVSILLSEPWNLSKRIYLPVALLWWKYFRVLTFQSLLLRLIPNARFWAAASSWVGQPTDAEMGTKSKHMSLIASAKMLLGGHKLRHAIARWVRAEKLDVDLLGLAYRPLANKRDGLLPYRFSVVIENSRERGYFTEKLVDALLCETVPIYWGAPDVGKFFDVGGMIVCTSESELRDAIRAADADLYAKMAPAVRRNRLLAAQYVDQEQSAAELLRREAQSA